MKNLKMFLLICLILIWSVNLSFPQEKLNLTDYPKNNGAGYEVSRQERYELLDSGKLFVWKLTDERGQKGEYIPLKDLKDNENKSLDIKKYFDLYRIDFDGDGVGELCVVPTMISLSEENDQSPAEWFYDACNYRITILRKVGQDYKPYEVATIGGDYNYLIDVRDLNGDGLLDVIFGSGAGASSYNDITEIFYFDKTGKTLKSQVFEQWVSLYDFNSDGIFEMAVAYPAGCNSCHAYWAHWSDIWKWDGKKYVLSNESYPGYYENIYLPDMLNEMIDCADSAPAVTDRVPLIERAWKLIIDDGLYKTTDEKTGKKENGEGLDAISAGNIQDARSHFERGSKLFPQNPELTNNLGYTYELQGDYSSAIAWYFKTLARDPKRSVAWYNMGCCKALSGDKEVGVCCFYNYIRFAPDKDSAKKAIKKLSESDKSEAVREAAKEAYTNYDSNQ